MELEGEAWEAYLAFHEELKSQEEAKMPIPAPAPKTRGNLKQQAQKEISNWKQFGGSGQPPKKPNKKKKRSASQERKKKKRQRGRWDEEKKALHVSKVLANRAKAKEVQN